jgi:hypothetical protein
MTESGKKYAVTLAVLSFGWLALFFYTLCFSHVAGPDADDYDFIYFIQAIDQGKLKISELFELYYGIHRPVMPRLLLFLEYKLFNGSGIFSSTFGVFFTLCSFLLFTKQILASTIKFDSKIFLIFACIIFVFSISQLAIINHPVHGLIRTPIVFLCLLCAHQLSKGQPNSPQPSFYTVSFFLVFGCISMLFDFFGLFILAFILFWLIVSKAQKALLFFTAAVVIGICFLSLPGDIILHTDTGIKTLRANSSPELYGTNLKPFFPTFFIYLFGYFSSAILPDISNASIILGGVFFIYCATVLIKCTFTPKVENVFFSTLLFIFFAHALIVAAGRYQAVGDYARYYVFVCWLTVLILFFILQRPTKPKMLVCAVLLLLAANSAIKQLDTKASGKNLYTKADINILNGSFYHKAYYRVNYPDMMIAYNPIAHYDSYLRTNKWGLYQQLSSPDFSKISDDDCEAQKIHSFIVSEKKFFEQELSGWNVSKNTYLKNIYAIDENKNLVAIGQSIPRVNSLLPVQFLPREKVEIYMIIPMSHPLRSLTLLGGDDKNLCIIKLSPSDSAK